MSPKLQNLAFVFILIFSLYGIIIFIPSQLSPLSSPKEPVVSDNNSFAIEVTTVPGAIRIKASGQELAEEEADYQAAREEFARRFGLEYDQVWESLEPIHHAFEVPEGLEDVVDFWTQVFGLYKKGEFIFYHKGDVGIVYSVVDLTHLSAEKSGQPEVTAARLRKEALIAERARIAQFLDRLAKKIKKGHELTAEEDRLYSLFVKNGDLEIGKASDSDLIGIQEGFAHRFKEAIVRSGQYLPEMENIFTMKGLPVELTRLPFIESAFNTGAVSSAQAVGIWQFIPDTGKRYLKIDPLVDERRDPLLATYAAAEHLAHEYSFLFSWPLTINAYNTGPGRMLKAVSQLNTTDIATIIKKFKDDGYRFYSRNYYPEFLAALHVYENREFYFGKLKTMDPMEYDLFMPTDFVDLPKLASSLDISPEEMNDLNPALSKKILKGEIVLPPGYLVRVPKDTGKTFAHAAIEQRKLKPQRWHLVKQGETLPSIAAAYNMPVKILEKANHFLPNQPLHEGMVLNLPSKEGLAFGNPASSLTP